MTRPKKRLQVNIQNPYPCEQTLVTWLLFVKTRSAKLFC